MDFCTLQFYTSYIRAYTLSNTYTNINHKKERKKEKITKHIEM